MNKRIKKKKKTQENKLLHKICKDIKRICNNYTFHYSSVPDSEKFSDLIEAFEKIKSGAETLEKGVPVDLPDINVSTQDTIEEIKKEIRDSINYILDAPAKKEEK